MHEHVNEENQNQEGTNTMKHTTHDPTDKPRRKNKIDIPPRTLEGVTLEVEPGRSVRVKAPDLDRTWRVGDEAQLVWHKYGYVDGSVFVKCLPIVDVTKDTVIFAEDTGFRTRRHKPTLFEFAEDQLFPAPSEESYGGALNPVWMKPSRSKRRKSYPMNDAGGRQLVDVAMGIIETGRNER